MGIVYAQISSQGCHLPLTKLYCHYLHPAVYDQIVTVETKIDYLKRASIKFNYMIWDEDKKKKLVEGYTVHACTDNGGNIIRIPETILKSINEDSKKRRINKRKS
jgi:acyl-CoA thioester hydrolase